MKLYFKDDDGKEIEVREIDKLDKDSDVIFFMLNIRLKHEDIRYYEEYMTNKVGKKCIVINSDINKILSM